MVDVFLLCVMRAPTEDLLIIAAPRFHSAAALTRFSESPAAVDFLYRNINRFKLVLFHIIAEPKNGIYGAVLHNEIKINACAN